MAGRLTQHELRAEVHAMCRRGGINPADVTVVFLPALEAEHCRNLRRYAQVDLAENRFEFATSVLDLPDVYREAVIAHEVGHVIAEREWGTSSEDEADEAASDFLGIAIDYDKAWPGKGLQMKTNPTMSKRDATYAFLKAMRDPDPSSTAVAQDIVLEHDLSLETVSKAVADKEGLGADNIAHGHLGPMIDVLAYGTFDFTALFRTYRVTWVVGQRRPGHTLRSLFLYDYGGIPGRFARDDRSPSVDEVVRSTVRRAWAEFARMKSAVVEGLTFRELEGVYSGALKELDALPREINPMKKSNPDDISRARDKYEEFHRYEPKKEIWSEGFKIPARMRDAGKSKWVTYRSAKVDPATLKKPKKPVDYIHEHNAGVHTYLPDDPDTDVPSSFRQVDALVKLGENLGFCFVDHDGEEIEAEGSGTLPELYTTPDGKCLLVIQDRKKVLAMIWGGGLGVFARGIDG